MAAAARPTSSAAVDHLGHVAVASGARQRRRRTARRRRCRSRPAPRAPRAAGRGRRPRSGGRSPCPRRGHAHGSGAPGPRPARPPARSPKVTVADVRGGGGEPADRVLAPVAVLVDAGHRERVQRLDQQRPQPGDRRGQVRRSAARSRWRARRSHRPRGARGWPTRTPPPSGTPGRPRLANRVHGHGSPWRGRPDDGSRSAAQALFCNVLIPPKVPTRSPSRPAQGSRIGARRTAAQRARRVLHSSSYWRAA